MPKISQYPPMTTLTGAEILIGDQAGITATATSTQLSTLIQGGFQFTDSGVANAYVLASPKALVLHPGQMIGFTPAQANTGASTATINGGSSVAIVDGLGNALTGGEIIGPVMCLWNGAQLEIFWSLPLTQKRSAAEISAGLTQVYQWMLTDPRRFGAKVDGATDDTAAIQNWINLAGNQAGHAQQVLLAGVGGVCRVSQITFAVAGIRFEGNGMIFQGNASVSTPSIVEIMGGATVGSCLFIDLKVDGSNGGVPNVNYQCGIHWYTNNTGAAVPDFMRFVGIETSSVPIGLCIGALPSQVTAAGGIYWPPPAQGTSIPKPFATNAPLSESSVVGLNTGNTCIIGVWGSQPNGKLSFTNCVVIGGHSGWSVYPTTPTLYTAASTCAMVLNEFIEISMQGGELVQNSESTGNFVLIGGAGNGAHLYCNGTVIEAECPSYLAGIIEVSFEQCLDLGWNFPSNYSPWLIDTNASGSINFTDCVISYPAGDILTGGKFFVKGASNILGTFSVNANGFVANFVNTELSDVQIAPINAASSYNPPVLGVEANYTNSRFTSYNGTPAIITLIPISDRDDRLQGAIDTSNYTISAFPQGTGGSSGGWTFVIAGGAGTWGSAASGISILGKTIDKALKIFGAVGSDTNATSAKFPVHPQRPLTLRGWCQGGSTGATIIVRVLWYTFSGSASATPSTDMLNAADTAIGGTIMPVNWCAIPPKDATQAAIYLEADNGATLVMADLNLR